MPTERKPQSWAGGQGLHFIKSVTRRFVLDNPELRKLLILSQG